MSKQNQKKNVELKIKPLHFIYDGGFNVRINRYLFNCLDHGSRPAFYFPEFYNTRSNARTCSWGFNEKDVDLVVYPKNRYVSNMIPAKHDPIGLKKVFKDFGCDVVHAHHLNSAY